MLYPGGKGLFHQGQWVPLRKRPYEVLLYLASRSGQVVLRDQLLAEVWGESRDLNVVEQCIHELRTRLGDQARNPRFIQTVHGAGYRFLPEVELVEAAPALDAVPAATLPVEPDSGKPAVARRVWIWGIVVMLAGAGILVLAPAFAPRPGSVPEVARFILAGPVVQAHDSTGRILWTHPLQEPAPTLTPEETKRRVWFVGDRAAARPERYLVAVPRASGSPGALAHRVLCFSASGKLLWEYAPRLSLEFASRTFDGGWEIQSVVPVGDTTWIAVKHEIWWPSFLVRMRNGSSEVVFVQSGVILGVVPFRRAGAEGLAVAGVNNEYGTAAVAVLDQPFRPAVSPQTETSAYRCRNCGAAVVSHYALPPRTDVSEAAGEPYNVASAVRFYGSSLEVEVLEAGKASSFYQFGLDLTPVGYAVSDNYPKLHDAFFRNGLLRHSAADCPQLANSRVVRVFRGGMWLELKAPRASDSQPLASRGSDSNK